MKNLVLQAMYFSSFLVVFSCFSHLFFPHLSFIVFLYFLFMNLFSLFFSSVLYLRFISLFSLFLYVCV